MRCSAKDRCETVIKILSGFYTDRGCDLRFSTPYQLFVALILAARCTDELVNRVTPVMWKNYPSAKELARASSIEIEGLIAGITYADAKAKNLLNSARILTDKYGGEIPCEETALLSLPGVGRKAANTLLAECFNKPTIAVDTHVQCVATRIGLCHSNDVLKTEKELCSLIPPSQWRDATHWLTALGKDFCHAFTPDCSRCSIKDYCKFNQPEEGKQLTLF